MNHPATTVSTLLLALSLGSLGWSCSTSTDEVAPTAVETVDDGSGGASGCVGPDCDDDDPEPPDAPTCEDADGDGYGVGEGCAGLDCNDIHERCWAEGDECCDMTITVATSGTDGPDCGLSTTEDCRTVKYAVESRATSGAVVVIEDGTYDEGQITVPEGVSLTSASLDADQVTIVPSESLWSTQPFIVMASADPGSLGNQSVSHLTFQGENGEARASRGFLVDSRDSVAIHHCVIQDFTSDTAVYFWQGGPVALDVKSSEIPRTNDWAPLVNQHTDMSKSTEYPDNPVADFHFHHNRVLRCGSGAEDGLRRYSCPIHPWHLYQSSFHHNLIDVSHTPTQAICGTAALLEQVDFDRNVIVGHEDGGYPADETWTGQFLIELWVLHDVTFSNNKLIRGNFSTAGGRRVEWFNNYVDNSTALTPHGLILEATSIDEAYIHHNRLVGHPSAGQLFGVYVGMASDPSGTGTAYVWSNIVHDCRNHGISVVATAPSWDPDGNPTTNAYVHNNLVDGAAAQWFAGISIWASGNGRFDTVEVRNNIITNNSFGIGLHPEDPQTYTDSVVLDTNVFWGNVEGDCHHCDPPPTNVLIFESAYADVGLDDFRPASAGAPQVDVGATLNDEFAMGLSPETDWGTPTSETVPQVVLRDQRTHGDGWEVGPYVW